MKTNGKCEVNANNCFPGTKSRKMIDEFKQYVAMTPQPFVLDLARCEGMWLATVDGQKIFDWAGYYGSKLLGHNHSRLREPEYLERLTVAANNKIANPDFLTDHIPIGRGRDFFGEAKTKQGRRGTYRLYERSGPNRLVRPPPSRLEKSSTRRPLAKWGSKNTGFGQRMASKQRQVLQPRSSKR